MTKHSSPLPKKKGYKGFRSSRTNSSASRRVPLWQAIILPVAAILIFFLLLEGGLALFGVKPTLRTEDPFVGFAANVPLFIPSTGSNGQKVYITAPNKLSFFNMQTFPVKKSPDTFRIFCIGGSTTYGRPYNDTTSFAGWLRELLPAVDRSRKWEVINAGGISYASYRVAHLMEELVEYQPDLFVIYTGHNEFLEERTYSKIKDIPPVIRTTISLLARTRTWSAMSSTLQNLGIQPGNKTQGQERLRGEVNAILDRSAGLNLYSRDDELRKNILDHYRISLERMVALAGSVGAKVMFVTPASNLKDSSPFKSEHTQGLDEAERQLSEQLLATAKELISKENWQEALELLEKGVVLDPRYAELQYRRGQALMALARFEEAYNAFVLARDEDVCPLRALTPMRKIVMDVAREQETGLVDFVKLAERNMQKRKGVPIPGKELFLDHVHPTIEGHEILAVALVQTLADQGLAKPGSNLNEKTITQVADKIESGIDQQEHAQALVNLARVLLWAGKTEDAERLAEQALAKTGDDPQVTKDINATLAKIYQKQGDKKRALQLLYKAIEKTPASIELHYMLGVALVEDGPHMQLEKAAANLLYVCQKIPYDDAAFQYFGLAMAKRDRMRIARSSLEEAYRLNPKNLTVKKALAQFPEIPGDQDLSKQTHDIMLEVYPTQAPYRLVQYLRNANGPPVYDGIMVEFYPNGKLKSFMDFELGKPHGLKLTFDAEGRVLSLEKYRQGRIVGD